jgi:hypothetical protein
MNPTVRRISLLLLCLVALAGCQKSDQGQSQSPVFNGVKVDLPKLDLQFTNASPELMNSVTQIRRYYRYSQFLQAMMELDKVSNDASLNEAQKKLISELLEQTKQVIAKAPPPPGQ